MTPDQKKDAERLERYLVREGLSAVMNETKWREAMDVLQELMGEAVRFRVKCVRDPEPVAGWERSFPYHVPRPYKAIEWLEIDPATACRRPGHPAPEGEDFTEKIVSAFQARGIPFLLVQGVIRIPGYIRPSPSAA